MPPTAYHTSTPPLGAHMSIAGGLDRAVERACSVESTALQVFLKNSNQWRGKAISAKEADAFKAAVLEAGLVPVVSHTSYLINMGTPADALAAQSMDALADELIRAAQTCVAGVVLHPGAHMGEGEAKGIERVAERINRVLEKTSKISGETYGGPPSSIFLETTAGQGTTLGWQFEHIAEMIARIEDKSRVAVCMDTCHVFAAGYAMSTAEDVRRTIDEFDRVIGLDCLRAIHINDSKMPFGSRRDRHEHIGQGEIGEECFAALLRDPRLAAVPMILETPKGEDLAEDKMNLATLRRLAAGGTPAPRVAKETDLFNAPIAAKKKTSKKPASASVSVPKKRKD